MKRVRETEKGERRERAIETERRSQSPKYFHFVSIWQPSGILMTGQSRWISRVESYTICVTAQFSSSAYIMGI